MPLTLPNAVRHYLAVIFGTAFIFLLTLVANEWIFRHSEYVRGVNWVYLPAGMRLLCTLVFGGVGAIGILMASLISCFFYYFPNDPVHALFAGIISALAPYLAYLFAIRKLGIRPSLDNLTAKRLLLLVLLYSIVGPAMQQSWSMLTDNAENAGERFVVMMIGDLGGTLIVVYTLKLSLWLITRMHGAAHGTSR
ncbi:hypothetical protein AWB64_00313 [Caballeronia sordidicola]|uniref:MASE1 protein n=1 Tax=Caballeronia sordidicola TaxID=196367 RepID=A0A158EUC5_CABSO|nr:hypothetical protein [Caballeronia sordidicola]SAL10699.1 hypothetical protein AWB64_00313 [Caballeronia sordidicola]